MKDKTNYKKRGFFRCFKYFSHRMKYRVDKYITEHLNLGRQTWKKGKLYIEKIPDFIISETSQYLTAIIRDYLRAYAKKTFAIGDLVYERNGFENWSDYLIAKTNSADWDEYVLKSIQSVEDSESIEDEEMREWREMINDVADKFDRAADLCASSWNSESYDEQILIWQEYRKSLVSAFDALKEIFYALDW